MEQQAVLTLTSEAQVRAVQDVSFLGKFLQPSSPSQVARAVGMKANLVHHHVRRLVALGLLFQVGRDGRKVLYQLAARRFQYPRDLPLSGGYDPLRESLHDLTEQIASARERSDASFPGDDPEYNSHGFEREWRPPPLTPEGDAHESHPSHLHVHTARVTPEQYRALALRVSELIREVEWDASATAKTCTFAWFAFEGEMRPGVGDGEWLSTFLVEEPA